jgi:hypothetical protein
MATSLQAPVAPVATAQGWHQIPEQRHTTLPPHNDTHRITRSPDCQSGLRQHHKAHSLALLTTCCALGTSSAQRLKAPFSLTVQMKQNTSTPCRSNVPAHASAACMLCTRAHIWVHHTQPQHTHHDHDGWASHLHVLSCTTCPAECVLLLHAGGHDAHCSA